MIYFIQNMQNGLVKVGFTDGDVRKRLKGLQTGSSDPLKVLDTMPGDEAWEGLLHDHLCDLGRWRIGEWFALLASEVAEIVRAWTPRFMNRGHLQQTLPFDMPSDGRRPADLRGLAFEVFVQEGRDVG